MTNSFLAVSGALLAFCGCSCGGGEKKPLDATTQAPSVATSQTTEGSPAKLSFEGPGVGFLFEAPVDYNPVDVNKNDLWTYSRALRSSRQKVEIRYGLAPKAVAEQLDAACGGDAKCKAAPSNKTVESLLDAAAGTISMGRKTNRRKAFPMDAVRNEFNAHWGGAVNYDLDPAFSKGYEQGVAIVIHREGIGTLMFTGLYDSHTDELEEEWMRAFHSLKFAEPFVPKESAKLAEPFAGTYWTCDEGFMQMRFSATTWTVIHVSVAMAAMGQAMPYEIIYHNVTYLPESRFSARVFRVDNMEQGDRTPKQPADERFDYALNRDNLVIQIPPALRGDGGEKKEWKCTLVRRR